MATSESAHAALARVLLGDALGVRAGENVLVETWNHTLPYAAACVVEARRRGAVPMLLLEDERAYWRSLDVAPASARWSRVGAHEWAALARTQAFVFFPGPEDRPRFQSLPAKRRTALLGYNDEWYRRARAARLRGVRSVLGYASDPQAERWGVEAGIWREQLFRGSVGVDLPAVRRAASRVAEKLRRGRRVRISAPNGTDLSLKLRGRRPRVDDGVVGPEDVAAGENMTSAPPGTVTVAVDERGTEGVAVANRPSYLRAGRVQGGQWEVHGGHLTSFWYNEGQPAFEEPFESAPRGRDVVGLLSLGLNPALAPGVPQVEDAEAGVVTVAVGGNRDYGGTNRCPFLSWIALGDATVAVDDAPLVDRGQFL
jgi:leucyl aminopeptidase (aminopeptidase T)